MIKYMTAILSSYTQASQVLDNQVVDKQQEYLKLFTIVFGWSVAFTLILAAFISFMIILHYVSYGKD
jgi:hypothetical protein